MSTKEQFLKDVQSHKMEVLKEDGLYRHLRFKRPESNSYWFDILTYPNNLVLNGDMGSWVFSRTEDMFDFFRQLELKIQPHYWAEKCLAQDVRTDGIKRFSYEVVENALGNYLEEWCTDCCIDPKSSLAKTIWKKIQEEVLSVADCETSTFMALRDFQCLGFSFADWWEFELTGYSTQYIWSLYAIVWAIAEYDKEKRNDI